MPSHLLLTVHLHDRRYHGVGDWPPAPARVFQALVAAAARGGAIAEADLAALRWLEQLPPPVIAAPRARRGAVVDVFVPNNDVDAVGGDPRRVEDIRVKKRVQPWLLADSVLHYVWCAVERSEAAAQACTIAGQLYQLGRGVDMAWATARLVDSEALEAIVRAHRGTIHRPGGDARSGTLACPAEGTTASLTERHAASRKRITADPANPRQQLFRQPPKARFAQVAYGSAAQTAIYELRSATDESRFAAWPLREVVARLEQVRDFAANRLRGAFPSAAAVIERNVVGRKADGADSAPIEERIRMTPLPSIGHEQADRAIRRLLVEIPAACPLDAGDVRWAFSGLETVDPATGVVDVILVAAADEGMLEHYRTPSRTHRTVTAAALPTHAARRRIDPARLHEDAKGAAERSAEDDRAVHAVRTALRHAGVRTRAVSVRVQREPLEGHGARAEAFAHGTRFAKERLWHVEVEFDEPVAGPLVVGDGRVLGLGVMAPARVASDLGVVAFEVEGGVGDEASPEGMARALRRAVMARVGAQAEGGKLSRYVSGHEDDGSPARTDDEPHLAFQVDGAGRLLVMPPHALQHRPARAWERTELARVEHALAELRELHAGRAGSFRLRRVPFDASDLLATPSTRWESVTPYAVERHARSTSASAMVAADVARACERSGLPRPHVVVREVRSVPGRGVLADVLIEFAVACPGPIAIGRTRHLGGGLFVPTAD